MTSLTPKPSARSDLAQRHVFLVAGSLCCAEEPTAVTTIVGSCVAICLWDRALFLGGMNHYVLPRGKPGGTSLRYGDTSIDRLVEGMHALGCNTRNLEAKIFGGAAVLSAGGPEKSVGTRNVAMALERLVHHGISVKARRTGGGNGLWIRMFTNSGDVLIRSVTH